MPPGMPTYAAVPVAAAMQASAPARAICAVDHARSQHDETDRGRRARADDNAPPVTITNEFGPPVPIAANDGTGGCFGSDFAARPTLAALIGLAALLTT